MFNTLTTPQGDRLSLATQIRNHKAIITRITNLQNNKTLTDGHLKRCIYLSNIGSNDYINNFLIPELYPECHKYSSDEYAAILVRQYSQHLTVSIYDSYFRFDFVIDP